jgi:hypothetical protein
MHGRLVVASCAVAVATAVGCTQAGRPARSTGVLEVKPTTTTVVVRNHHEADLRVFVMTADGKSYRLGLVPKFGAATLVLPSAIRLPAEVSFAAIPMSNAEPQAVGPIEVDIGTRLVFTVAYEASLSTLTRLP